MQYDTNKNGFTLIETLVAITILMVAIAGPLSVASKAYNASLDVRDQTIATNLAQETMEYLKNDVLNRGNFDTIRTVAMVSSCIDASLVCKFHINPDGSFGSISVGSGPMFEPHKRLWKSVDDGYVSNGDWVNGFTNLGSLTTPFSRYYYVESTTDPKQVIATVIVSWGSGSSYSEVKLNSILSLLP